MLRGTETNRNLPPFSALTNTELDTAILPEKSSRLQRLIDNTANLKHGNNAKTLHQQRELILLIRGITERFSIMENCGLIIGRLNANDEEAQPDIDLMPYGGMARGISRHHARLDLVKGKHLYVTDLDSTNGTFIKGERLEKFISHPVEKGDVIILGRLPIQLFFR